jgi:hypothetical protein
MRHTIAKLDGRRVAQRGHSKCCVGNFGERVRGKGSRKTEIDDCTSEQSGELHGNNGSPMSVSLHLLLLVRISSLVFIQRSQIVDFFVSSP